MSKRLRFFIALVSIAVALAETEMDSSAEVRGPGSPCDDQLRAVRLAAKSGIILNSSKFEKIYACLSGGLQSSELSAARVPDATQLQIEGSCFIFGDPFFYAFYEPASLFGGVVTIWQAGEVIGIGSYVGFPTLYSAGFANAFIFTLGLLALAYTGEWNIGVFLADCPVEPPTSIARRQARSPSEPVLGHSVSDLRQTVTARSRPVGTRNRMDRHSNEQLPGSRR
jgi:hypothetical protein